MGGDLEDEDGSFIEMEDDEELEDDDEEDEEDDIEENDDENLGKRKSPEKKLKSILKKEKPQKKLKTTEKDGPESTINSDHSDTEGDEFDEDDSSFLDLSSDDGFNSERRKLGFMQENDIYTH